MKVIQRVRITVSALALISLFLFSGSAGAVEMQGLYDAELPVEEATTDERSRLTEKGLREVLIRVSGSYQALEHDFIRNALRSPDRYLQQYSYLKMQPDDAEEVASQSQLLQLQFDQTLVDDLLRRARMQIWGKNRPSLLIWVAIDDQQGRHILSAGENTPFKQSLLAVAKKRGIPVLFPLMDLQDKAALSIVEAWGLFREPLQNASLRYHPEAILAGRLYQNAKQQWTGRWQFIFNSQMQGLSANAPDLETYPQSGIDYVVDLLAEYYAINTAAMFDESVRFQVKGVNSLSAYAEVVEYLENLAVIIEVTTAEVNEDTLILTLTTEGKVEKLAEAIALDHKLIPRQTPESPSVEKTLYYRWYKK